MGDAFKALADPTRRRILELLAQGDLTAGEIAAHFDMTKPSVSHHLNILRSAALITDDAAALRQRAPRPEHCVQCESDRISGIDEVVL